MYNDIDEELIKTVATKTKGSSGPSELDADGWRKIIVSSWFGTAISDLHEAVTELAKNLYITNA